MKQEKEAKKAASAREKLTLSKAAHLIDKNSHTIAKLNQLLEAYHKPNRAEIDKDRLISRRIEKLKARINRRLVKLAKWVDTPDHERITHHTYSTRAQSRSGAQSRSYATLSGQANGSRGRYSTSSRYAQSQPAFSMPRATPVPPPGQNQSVPASAPRYVPNSQPPLMLPGTSSKSLLGITSAQPSQPPASQPSVSSNLSVLMALQKKMMESVSNAVKFKSPVASSNKSGTPALSTDESSTSTSKSDAPPLSSTAHVSPAVVPSSVQAAPSSTPTDPDEAK
eukprot:CAMPEP_0185032684 /NCGR_PEP_ID=MMETSP1103-20130426/20964_1 /TAXON_ID=36769 /ORGANISM="Paraphysomonas bandaiensis, Strain Caron Lab Isolate" /LENGTH=280 /DNA_ID=CAMNT_0027568667 /DNA_START=60 /DNA_END=902 /DNA_ORIENTATION=+